MRKVRRNLLWDREAWQDYLHWLANDREIFEKINKFIEECLGDEPFKGTGKPELLKRDLAGYWSRRINHKHRFVYDVTEDHIFVLLCRDHYNDK